MLSGLLCNSEALYFNINESLKEPTEPLTGRQCLHVMFQIHHGSALHESPVCIEKASFANVI